MRNAPYIVAGLGDPDMIWLLSIGRLRKLSAGKALVEAGRAVEDLFFVISGDLAVLLPDGRRVATLSEGDVVGEMSFVERHPPSTTVRADASAEVLAIPRQAILQRFDQEPLFAARFYRALAVFLSERLRDTTATARPASDEQEERLMTQAATARFRRLLGMFARGG